MFPLPMRGPERVLLDLAHGVAGDGVDHVHLLGALVAGQSPLGAVGTQVGDLEGSLAALEEALDWHARMELPLDRGRTLLALGATQRRVKRRREARLTLEEALAVFEDIGAALWAERARAELKRISPIADPTPNWRAAYVAVVMTPRPA